MDITTRGTLVSPIAQAWEVLADFPGLALWHPLIERCEAEGSYVGALRTVHFADRTVVERLDEIDEIRHTLVYRVVRSTRPATIGFSARITLTSLQSTQTLIEWVASVPPSATHLAADFPEYYARRIEHLQDELTNRASTRGLDIH